MYGSGVARVGRCGSCGPAYRIVHLLVEGPRREHPSCGAPFRSLVRLLEAFSRRGTAVLSRQRRAHCRERQSGVWVGERELVCEYVCLCVCEEGS